MSRKLSVKVSNADDSISEGGRGDKNTRNNAGDSENKPMCWISASAVTVHSCGDPGLFTNFSLFPAPKEIRVGNGQRADAIGQGEVVLEVLVNGKWTKIPIRNVHYVPGGANVFSELVMINKNYTIEKKSGRTVYYEDGNRSKPGPEAILSEDAGLHFMCFRRIK